MESCAEFMLKSPIITFCEEECWPKIVQRAESKRGIETWGERLRNNFLINFISIWPVRRKQEHLLAKNIIWPSAISWYACPLAILTMRFDHVVDFISLHHLCVISITTTHNTERGVVSSKLSCFHGRTTLQINVIAFTEITFYRLHDHRWNNQIIHMFYPIETHRLILGWYYRKNS